MKKIPFLKLSQLNKSSMASKQLNQIRGGNYCWHSYENRVANKEAGKCSCYCATNMEEVDAPDDYYADSLHYDAVEFKNYEYPEGYVGY